MLSIARMKLRLLRVLNRCSPRHRPPLHQLRADVGHELLGRVYRKVLTALCCEQASYLRAVIDPSRLRIQRHQQVAERTGSDRRISQLIQLPSGMRQQLR